MMNRTKLTPIRGLARTAALILAAGTMLAAGATAASAAPAAHVNVRHVYLRHVSLRHADLRRASVRRAAWPTTIAQAQARWPGAKLAPSGARRLRAGRYIVRDATGHYDLVSVSVSAARPLTRRATVRAAAGAYCTGCLYGVTVNVDTSSFLYGTQSLDTYNGVDYGYSAWNIYETPGCFGAGSCQAPQYGVIGNHSAEVNPWDNQYVNYWGCCTRVAYLRVYVTDRLGISGWAVLD